MANFQTHIAAGVLTSGLVATVAMAGAVVTPQEAVALTLAGVVGSILPDIDLESSRQSRSLFGAFGIFFAFIFLFQYSQTLSIVELWLIWLAVYLSIRYGLWRVFQDLSTHRGMTHSLLASSFFALATVVICDRVLGYSDLVSWLAGSLMLLGCLTHLLLDELYSIDFGGNRVKRSFGTALKLYNYKTPLAALALVAACVGLFRLAPPAQDFLALVSNSHNWAYLEERLLPEDKWFDI